MRRIIWCFDTCKLMRGSVWLEAHHVSTGAANLFWTYECTVEPSMTPRKRRMTHLLVMTHSLGTPCLG